MTPNLPQSSLRAIDFFCGAGGMSLGLRHAGIEVIAGIDIDGDCGQTFQTNIAGAEFIQADVSVLKPADLETQLGIRKDDDQLVMVGCSPCQHYSQIRTDRTKSTSTALLLNHFQRFVEYFRPGFVVIENVPRLAKVNVLIEFIKKLEECGYSTAAGILNAAFYGVPQNRLRYLLVASRNGEKASLPPPSGMPPMTLLQTIGPSNGFPSIPAGHRDDSDFQHTTAALSENNLRRMSMTPPDGGQRDAWASHPTLQLDAYKNRDEMFRDSYGRMFWGKPAPTITTKFLSISNGRFGHPSEARGISVREGATLQSFPRTFRFHSSSLHGLATQIGNAVPPELARHVGAHLRQLSTSNSKAAHPAKIDGRKVRAKATFASVSTASRDLIARGLQPTASAVLAVTGGSKQSVLKHLKAIQAEKTQNIDSGVPIPLSIATDELGPILRRIINVADVSVAERPETPPNQLQLLEQAISLGYINLVLTPLGANRVGQSRKSKY